MSKIDYREGILSGSIDGLTGVVHKEKNFVRKRVIPYDPKTQEQVNNRNTIALFGWFARQILSDILDPLTRPKPKKSTAYNRFLQVNKALLNGVPRIYQDFKLCDGTLSFTKSWAANPNPTWGWVQLLWERELIGEGSMSDIAIGLCVDSVTEQFNYNISEVRTTEWMTIMLPGVPTGNILHCWLAFSGDSRMSISELKSPLY